MKKTNTIIALLGFIGLALFLYSFMIDQYTNESEFQKMYMSLDAGNSNEFYKLRDEYDTNKYRYFDYGIELIAMSIYLFSIINLKRLKLPAISNFIYASGYSLSIPIIFSCSYVFEILQSQSRNEYPWWADTIMIPLLFTPFVAFIAFVWILLFLIVHRILYNRLKSRISLYDVTLNRWQIGLIGIHLILLAYALFYGTYWVAIPVLLLIHYIASITNEAVFRKDKTNRNKEQGLTNGERDVAVISPVVRSRRQFNSDS